MTAGRDQEAARIREWRQRVGLPSSAVQLDRGEMEDLVRRGASGDEIRVWLQVQIDRHIAACR